VYSYQHQHVLNKTFIVSNNDCIYIHTLYTYAANTINGLETLKYIYRFVYNLKAGGISAQTDCQGVFNP